MVEITLPEDPLVGKAVGNDVGTIDGKLVPVVGCIVGVLVVDEETLILRTRLLPYSAMYTLPDESNETPEG